MGLKTVKRQAKDQRQKLHITEIELDTQRQLVLDLKVKLKKARESAQVVKEVSEAAEMASYEQGVQETEGRLAKELTVVCRDYCSEVWAKALNRAEFSTTSEWRLAENVYYLEDIWEAPTMLPSPAVLALPPLEQPSTTQTSLPPPKVVGGKEAG